MPRLPDPGRLEALGLLHPGLHRGLHLREAGVRFSVSCSCPVWVGDVGWAVQADGQPTYWAGDVVSFTGPATVTLVPRP